MVRTRTLLSLFVFLSLLMWRAEFVRAGASMALHVGLEAGGELFRVVSPDPIAGTRYLTPDGRPLVATEFRTELDENLAFGLRVRVPVRPRWSVSFGLSGADLDVAAKRRTVTESVDNVVYDQMFALHGDISAEFDWLEQGNRPFLTLGLGFVSLGFQGRRSPAESLDQTPMAIVVGGGFRVRSMSAMDLDFEARGFRVAPDWGSEEDRLVPAESFDGMDSLWLWQITVAAVYEF
jgi:hypothetical protein